MTRAEQYAAQLTAVNGQVLGAIGDCTEVEWRRVCVGEERTVGVVAHHIATVEGVFAAVIRALSAGGYAVPNLSAAELERMNARHAEEFATVGKAETLELVRTNGASVADAIAVLDDAQLEQVAGVFGGHELRVAQLVELALIAHIREHLASIHATCAAA